MSTKIEWTGETWNPVTGCVEVSPGCDNCYAKTLAERFRGTPGHYYENGFDVQLRPAMLHRPWRWRAPTLVFVNSMSDLFHTAVPDEYIAQVFAVMAATPRHTYQILTKRHGRMRNLLSSIAFWKSVQSFLVDPDWWAATGSPETGGWTMWDNIRDRLPLTNVWLGVSVEDQKRADLRVPVLLNTPAAIRFLSCEPLLCPVDLTQWLGTGGVDWVITGGESGHGARPMHPAWAKSLRDQCAAHEVAFLHKQNGAFTNRFRHPDGASRSKGPDVWVNKDGRTSPPVPLGGDSWVPMWRVGKKAAGRELDGATHDGYPQVAHV